MWETWNWLRASFSIQEKKFSFLNFDNWETFKVCEEPQPRSGLDPGRALLKSTEPSRNLQKSGDSCSFIAKRCKFCKLFLVWEWSCCGPFTLKPLPRTRISRLGCSHSAVLIWAGRQLFDAQIRSFGSSKAVELFVGWWDSPVILTLYDLTNFD